ncbi:tetratricopeptide repeat protein [Persicimonas caeni]|uniref:Tetratricopeptide repeat protein n=1 Tax=Persicimonas caeni TaxID=2292766 RepID=A0A4Y6PRY4_PERCE|nr:tetratricopeptide repeat protein [Persicimonas caeni]QDG50777.1 tetratricopeptide repeat protein [Persicimonas caeni]QED31998.1 tetratricopeptide repeat protein [Persicimonas caeni]
MEDEEKARREYLNGMQAFDEERYELALRYFRESSRIDEHFKTWQRIAQVLEKLGRATEAEEYYERAHQANPANSQVAVDYARVLLANQRVDEALELLEDVLRANTTYGAAKKLIAQVEEERGSAEGT